MTLVRVHQAMVASARLNKNRLTRKERDRGFYVRSLSEETQVWEQCQPCEQQDQAGV